jgi:hypothetical protein
VLGAATALRQDPKRRTDPEERHITEEERPSAAAGEDYLLTNTGPIRVGRRQSLLETATVCLFEDHSDLLDPRGNFAGAANATGPEVSRDPHNPAIASSVKRCSVLFSWKKISRH